MIRRDQAPTSPYFNGSGFQRLRLTDAHLRRIEEAEVAQVLPWTTPEKTHHVRIIGRVGEKSSARRSLRTTSSAECFFRPAMLIVPSGPHHGVTRL